MEDVRETLTEIDAANERLVVTVERLTDDHLRGPSRLPGWSRGHVLAHLARNADSCWNLLEWARTRAEYPQYPSDEAREAGVRANAGRPIEELRSELLIAIERLDLQSRTMPTEAWQATVRARGGWSCPAWYVLRRRWRELEAHHVDLDAGFDHTDWPRAYVRWELGDTLAALRLDGGLAAGRVRATDLDVAVELGAPGPEISGTGHELLGWLTGRAPAAAKDWPAPPSWPPAAPHLRP
jgi:maleylpyruvate isomerase